MNINVEKIIEVMTTYLKEYSPKVIAALLVLVIGKIIARKIANLISKLLKRNKVDITLIGFLESIIYYTLLIIVVIAAAGQLGINTTSFLTIVGAAGLAVGLALKDTLSNFASGVMLILFAPFRVGDAVNAGGVGGKVEKITVFNTIIHTPDNQKVIVPNSNITSGVITNITANPTRRVDLSVGIGYGDSIPKAKDILNRIVKEDKRILPDPAPTIAVSELGSSSVNFVIRPWVKKENYWDVYFSLTEKIKITFDEEGVSIPYPQTDVHLFQEGKKES
ncbi:MAG: mechanosensitive ion channel [Proteobacteria bacterium]|nr:mechanosensitive ion channel [Pseudomonadota bacterium]